jgi:hypothetical protein
MWPWFYAFDVLSINGQDLRGLPLRLRSAFESNGAFDVLGVQLRLGPRDHRDAAEDDGDHHPRENVIGDHSRPSCLSDGTPQPSPNARGILCERAIQSKAVDVWPSSRQDAQDSQIQ